MLFLPLQRFAVSEVHLAHFQSQLPMTVLSSSLPFIHSCGTVSVIFHQRELWKPLYRHTALTRLLATTASNLAFRWTTPVQKGLTSAREALRFYWSCAGVIINANLSNPQGWTVSAGLSLPRAGSSTFLFKNMAWCAVFRNQYVFSKMMFIFASHQVRIPVIHQDTVIPQFVSCFNLSFKKHQLS